MGDEKMATIEELEQKIRNLEAKLEVQEDVSAIMNLKGRYTQIADSRQYAKNEDDRKTIATDIANLFTEDALWDGGKTFGTHRGRKEIYEYFRQPSWKLALHFAMNPQIHVEGSKARGYWYLFLPGITKENVAAWMGGFYEDEYVKKNDRWLFKIVKPTFLFLTPYEDGWVKTRFIGSTEKD